MGFLDSLLGLFGDVAGEIESIVAYLFNLFITGLQFLWNVITVFGNFVLTIFKNIGSFFSHLWDGFFSNIFVRVFNALRTFGDWLARHLASLLDWLQRAQRYILHLYNLYVRPILIMIQRIRQVLQILRALHIQWAQDLDNILAHVQSDINAVFLKINGTINAVIDVINIVTDPARLLRHPMLLLSLRRSFLALIRQLTGMPPGYFFPSRRPSAAPGVKSPAGKLNLLDPASNPPPSYYMGLGGDVPGFGLFPTGQEVPDSYADDVDELDFFNSDFASPVDCDDALTCFFTMRDEVIAGVSA